MKYAELIQFDPIEDVIELRAATRTDIAANLVRTFVISDRMAAELIDRVIPELQYGKPKSNMGLFVVGNYGTGKSHLLACLSAIAENAELLSLVTNDGVKTAAEQIAGQFQVSRLEIGAVRQSLRDIICGHLEEFLEERDIDFSFPSAKEIKNNKDSLEAMMAVFHEEHPDEGLLLVVDELLDYLRSRNDQELALDLGFLRELGEICKTTRFRIIAGIQESLFDSPRFQFIQESVRRVQDRFIQFRIAREDIAFIVANRLLQKSPEQQARIREHLTKFVQLYGSMNERLDRFVELFPVHPAYLETFEQVYVAEKREVLRTLSHEIKKRLDDTVPPEEPGLIAYDSYWQTLTDNPAFRAIPEVKEVLDRSSVLEGRIKNAFPKPQYKPVALRIIHGLSVHRLTTGDLYKPLGPTAEELRDNLCLHLQLPEQETEFLRTLIETVLRDIITTANGQFISFNSENGQYYLDLKKDVDFDALIEKRAESLSGTELDRYYFEALRQVVLENPGMAEYVSGYRIWEHELIWRERKAGRPGYLFFGAPNERSTAQPPRDFYVYFIQPFDPPSYTDEKRDDEVFFVLKKPDAAFEAALRSFAGARAQAINATGANKKIYEEKALGHIKTLTAWLRTHMATAFDVVYQGASASLAVRTQGKVSASEADSVRDLGNAAAAICLGSHFAEDAPEYPQFEAVVTRENREQAADEAIRMIATGHRSKQGAGMLDALKLLDGETISIDQSPYAADILDRLEKKGEGQVLNRSELVEAVAPDVEYWAPSRFRLEPELLAVVLAAIVKSGEATVGIVGQKLDASSTDKLASIGARNLSHFKQVERPRDLPITELKAVFRLLGLNDGLLVQPATRDEAAKQLVTEAAKRVESVLAAQQALQNGVSFWGKPILAEAEKDRWIRALNQLKTFLEGLQPYNTGGKLKNFRPSAAEIEAERGNFDRLTEVLTIHRLVVQLQASTGYLSTAEAVLPEKEAWIGTVKKARQAAHDSLMDPDRRSDTKFVSNLDRTLETLQKDYRARYIDLHGKARLNAAGDKKKGALVQDPRLRQLRALAAVEGMPRQALDTFEDQLHGLKTCFALVEKDLTDSPICPHCSFRPSEEAVSGSASVALQHVEAALDRLHEDWIRMLLADLDDPMVVKSIELLGEGDGAAAVLAFREERELPDPAGPAFIRALQEVLSGLEGVPVARGELLDALTKGGARCTHDDLRSRLDGFLSAKLKGKEPAKVRLIIE